MAKQREPEFVPQTPTKILTATRYNTTIVRKLYGEVTPERLEREQREVNHRAEQLSTPPPRPSRPVREPGNYTRE